MAGFCRMCCFGITIGMDPIKQTREHLNETGWGYWQHLLHSIKQSKRLMVIAVKSIVHGIFPWWFASSGPVGIYQIYQEIRRLHHVQKLFQKYDQTREK